MKLLCLVVILLFTMANAQASSWGMAVGSANFDSGKAEEEGVEDSATMLSAIYENHLTDEQFFSAGVNIYLLDDNESFTNNTTGGVKSSSASAGGLYGEYGIKLYLSDRLTFSVAAGYEVIASASRRIANCIDCDSESIDIDGGPFVRAGLRFHNEGGYSLSLSANQYLNSEDGLKSTITFVVIFGNY